MDISGELMKRLDGLTEKLGTTAKDMWPKIVRAERIKVIQNLIAAGMFFLLSAVIGYIAYKLIDHYIIFKAICDGYCDLAVWSISGFFAGIAATGFLITSFIYSMII